MGEEMNLEGPVEAKEENEPPKGSCCECFWIPIDWIKMLATEMHWTFVFGVVVVYGISQGLGGALFRVGTEYYMKDVQKVQPSESQVYSGITSIPWIVKPLWGLLTDVLPIYGYRRRPYFILAGFLGVISMLVLSLLQNLHLALAVLSLTAGSTGVAIADVTIDACIAQNSISHPSLASDMQSLCTLCASIGALVGYSISGIFVHLIGPKGVYGLMTIPYGLVFLVGILLNEPQVPDFNYKQVNQKFLDAGKAMWTTLKFPLVWRPCLYMYLSFTLSLNIYEGLFYWYTDSEAGPAFSQETVGYILSIGPVGSMLAAILYQNSLKDYPFRDILFWAQLLSGLSGMLDLMLVLRLNLAFGIPDFVAIVIDEGVSRMVGQMKWMPLLVLSSRLCPSGIEGTFFALLMSIDNAGLLSSSWLGGLLLHVLKVTRSQFDNLWLAIIIRNISRLAPLCIIFLVPRGDPDSSFLPDEVPSSEEATCDSDQEPENIELVALVNGVDDDSR
ncbi:probable folate-biopterin transporter 2 isoform X2 [Mangifera indica]|uniref:probable folate-biopterin transporter 2 isoform X2 n=1 Tax=Mangifera indica TaxID=29780 RepID=UPI001CFA0B64|nr:probable folate-biopterin transporter 2 isoform X2 [Mangifera indica]